MQKTSHWGNVKPDFKSELTSLLKQITQSTKKSGYSVYIPEDAKLKLNNMKTEMEQLAEKLQSELSANQLTELIIHIEKLNGK